MFGNALYNEFSDPIGYVKRDSPEPLPYNGVNGIVCFILRESWPHVDV